MRARPGVILAAAIGLVCILAGARCRRRTGATAELFDTGVMQEIRLSVNSRDLRALREYLENTYYTADLTWKNVKVRNVGIRSRGQGSRNPIKLGLRVDMARYTTGQTFVGLSTIVLDNVWQDASMLRERLAFSFFDRLGLGAPRGVLLPAVHQQRVSGAVRDHRGDRRAVRPADHRRDRRHDLRVPLQRRPRSGAPRISATSQRYKPLFEAADARARRRHHALHAHPAAVPRSQRARRRRVAGPRGAVHRSRTSS